MCIIIYGEKRMTRNKLATAIAMFLIITMAVTTVAFPPVRAQTIPAFLLLNVAPNPIGVGQAAEVNAFLSKPPITASLGGTGDMYTGITVEVTKPDGTKQTLGPFTSDATGGTYTTFTPNAVGNYTFKATYPGQHIEGWSYPLFGPPSYINVTYTASTSSTVTLVVQEEPIPTYSSPPLPTEYWSRPIYATNYAWAQLGGSWFGLAPAIFATTGGYDATGNFNPYTTAPNTAHILWTKPTHFGGQVGAPISADQMSQYMSTTIATNFFEPVILNGVLYYTHFAGPNAAKASWEAVDIRTGEVLWSRSAGETGNEVIRMGQILRWHSIQEYGSWAFLYGCESGGFFQVPTFFSIYDAYTGEFVANITDIQNPSFLMDLDSEQEGTLLAYYIASDGSLTLWNSTKLMMSNSFDQITIRPSGTYNWSAGIQWQKPLPTTVGSAPIEGFLGIAAITHDVILLRYAPSPGMFVELSYGSQITAGIDAKTGQVLWGPINQTIPNLQDVAVLATGDDVYVLHDKDTNEAYGYSLKTGNLLWGPVQLPGNALSHLSRSAEIAYGKVFIWDFGGYVNALNATTGKIEWTFVPRSAGFNTGYGVYPLWYTGSICDGKLFLSESHMYNPPMFPGAQRLVIDCNTGKLVWSILAFDGRVPAAHADGFMVEWNSYDSQIYSYGKGQTTATIEASPKVSVFGSSVLVEGTVMDESPGTKNSDRIARFPHGVPAVSDGNMSTWMEYVYMQQPKPADIVGVEVVVEVLDSNHNYYEVGRTTSDENGFFKLAFTPQVPGEYSIYARFAGSESYWPSSAVTAINVEEAPAATATPSPAPASLADQYILPGIGGIIAAIAIVGIVLALLTMRKK
jgi:PQQ-like domain